MNQGEASTEFAGFADQALESVSDKLVCFVTVNVKDPPKVCVRVAAANGTYVKNRQNEAPENRFDVAVQAGEVD